MLDTCARGIKIAPLQHKCRAKHPYPGCTMFSISMHPLLHPSPKPRGGAILMPPNPEGVQLLMPLNPEGVQFMMPPNPEGVQFLMPPKPERVQFLMHTLWILCLKNTEIDIYLSNSKSNFLKSLSI